MIEIRTLTHRDINFVDEMIKAEDWHGYSVRDLRRCLEYEPRGCFIAEKDGEPAGHIFSISYGKLGWVGLLIVRKGLRGQGIGAQLMTRAIEYLRETGVETIKLEAVPAATALYKKIGFREEFESLRFMIDGGTSFEKGYPQIRVLGKDDIEDVTEFDSYYFGAPRGKVLVKLREDFSELCFIARKNGEILGYSMCRETDDFHRLGPWVCNPAYPGAAEALLRSTLSAVGQAQILVGVPSNNAVAVELLQKYVAKPAPTPIRMFLGQKDVGHIEGIFAIGGPEKG